MSLTLRNGYDKHSQLMRLLLTILCVVQPVKQIADAQKVHVATGLRLMSKLILLILKTSLMGV